MFSGDALALRSVWKSMKKNVLVKLHIGIAERAQGKDPRLQYVHVDPNQALSELIKVMASHL